MQLPPPIAYYSDQLHNDIIPPTVANENTQKLLHTKQQRSYIPTQPHHNQTYKNTKPYLYHFTKPTKMQTM